MSEIPTYPNDDRCAHARASCGPGCPCTCVDCTLARLLRERDEARNHLTAAQRQLDEQQETLGRIAALYNGFVNSNPPAWGADATLAAIGETLGPPWQDSRLSPRDLRRCRFCGEIRAKHDPETRHCRVGTVQRFWPVGEPGGG